jgi:hypothetical protein
MGRAADPADEIEQHEIGTAAPDLESEGVGAVRVERYRNGWLTDASTLWLLLENQTVRFELLDDHRDRLCRQSRQAGDLRLRQTPMATNERQRQPLIIKAHAALVRAAGEIRRLG